VLTATLLTALCLLLTAAPALAAGPPYAGLSYVNNVTATSAHIHGSIIPRGSETHWRFEYVTARHFETEGFVNATVGPEGTIPQSEADEEFHQVFGDITGLSSASAYYVRLFAENGLGSAPPSRSERFETSGPPMVETFAVHALHGEVPRIIGSVDPHNSGLNEIQTVTIGGAPTGGTFTLTLEGQATASTAIGNLTAGSNVISDVLNTGSREFDARSFILGQPISGAGIPAGAVITARESHEDTGGTVTISQPATVSGTAVALTTGLPRIPFDADNVTVLEALETLPNIGEGTLGVGDVEGPRGGPYTVEFSGSKGSTNLPSLEADASGLTPSGTVTVATVQDGFSYPTHYHFEYINVVDFQANGESFSGSHPATVTAEHQVEGTSPQIVGQDLPELQPGETYRYRIVATNTTPGNPVVYGAEQTLTVPVPAAPGVEEPCANAATRIGLSAGLPDCRAYEQVSPVDKEGAQEAFQYGGGVGAGALVGEDGNHFMFTSSATRWGTSPTSGQSPYFFTRNPQSGWQMTAGAAQPEAGFAQYTPLVFNPDLTAFGFESGWFESPDIEFKAGSPGGPYATVATVPRKQVNPGAGDGWVGASEDFSKLILAVEDRKLVEPQSTTRSGSDLYEYSAGQLRQVNVDSAGETIGSCGATIVNGNAETTGLRRTSTRHAVSADGSRVFFSARPGANCSEPERLYMREAAVGRTLDIGAYRFLAANAQGSEVMLEALSGETREVLLYNTETATSKLLFSEQEELHLKVSRDFGTIYLTSAEQLPSTEAPPTVEGNSDLYRYEISTGTLSFVLQYGAGGGGAISPDGRYDYFESAGVSGVPGGAPSAEGGGNSIQLYRYDSVTDSVECVSCASPFDPEPGLGVQHTGGSLATNWATDGTPQETYFSANGDYAFFETPAALLLADVNGEIPPLEAGRFGGTPSNDVYEWRREGLHGCAHLQGCLSLITPGTSDGYLVALLGTTESGNDVFFYTSSQLHPADNDTAGDFYDARVGGGFAEPVSPVECEGDACVSPLAAPIDTTPASLSFSGPGNSTPSLTTPRVKVKSCKKRSCRKKARARKLKRRKAKGAARREGGHKSGGSK
jgi:hypothetical protein